jgi:polyribonucleotide nucleotidyltransferase
LFNAKDCITRDTLGEMEEKSSTKTVKSTLLVSDYDAGAIIGTKGTAKNKISKETGVRIIVGGGSKNRVVELWGEEAGVAKALEMTKEITEM